MSRALSTWASVPLIRSETSATTWPSPRCSRSMFAACQSRVSGSSGIGSERRPAYITRPCGGALELRGLDEVAEDPAQCRHAAPLACGVRRLGGRPVPDPRDVAGHLAL